MKANNSILPSCRLEWGGIEAYGEEAISEAFRASPLKGDVHFVECAHACLLRVNEGALFADLFDHRVGRLWRVGKASSNKPEPRLSMPFDPDLQQERGSIQFRLADHPSLDRRPIGRTGITTVVRDIDPRVGHRLKAHGVANRDAKVTSEPTS